MALLSGLLLFVCAYVKGADVILYSLVKSQGWQQTGPAEISRSAGDKFVFEVGVIESAPSRVGTASIQLPATSMERPLKRELAGSYDLSYANSSPPNGGPEMAAIADFDSAYPNGTYVLRLSAVHDGTRVIPLTLTGDAYPSVPQISNFADAQQISPTNPFTLSWFPFVGGVASDFIHLRIENDSTTIYTSGLPGASSALNGTSKSATVPAGLLQPGKTYRVYLFFAKAFSIDKTSYPGATGYIGYGQTLYTTLKTAGPQVPPSITTQPESQSIRLGESATLNVIATGTQPLLYQWFLNSQKITNGTNALLTITSAQLADAGAYTVHVTDLAGRTVTSQPATLNVAAAVQSFNRVISLDGRGSYVSIPNDAGLQNGQAFSLELWCLPTATAGNKFGSIVNKGDGATGASARSYELRWTPDNLVSLNLFFERVPGSAEYISLPVFIPSNRWTHFAATFDSSKGEAAVYTNGVLATKTTDLTGRIIRQTSLPLVLGWTPTYLDTYASGFLDEIRIWKVARTANEIQQDMGCTLTGAESGLHGYWNFDPSTYEDRSGHGLNGTAIGNISIIQQTLNEDLLAGCDRAVIFPVVTSEAAPQRWTLKARVGASYVIESSTNFVNWKDFLSLPDERRTSQFQPPGESVAREFFRAVKRP